MKKAIMRNEIISALMFASFVWMSVPTAFALLVVVLTDYGHPLYELSEGMLFAGAVYCVVFLLCWSGFATEGRRNSPDDKVHTYSGESVPKHPWHPSQEREDNHKGLS